MPITDRQLSELLTVEVAPAEETEVSDRQPVTEALEAQGPLEPGQEGWWKVWGASPRDIRPGDLVMVGWREGDEHGVDEHAVGDFAPRGNLMDTVRIRFREAGTEDQFFSVGMLQPIGLLRRGTHHVLSDSVR